MKTKISLFFLLFIGIAVTPLKAQQRFRAGIKAGLSTSQVSGDTYSGYNKAGFAGGGFVSTALKKNWSGQFEIIYIQKGSQHNANPDVGDYNYYFLKLDYVEVPLLLQYHQKNFTYHAGPSISVLIKEEELFNFMDLTGVRPFNTTEVSVNVGLGYTIFKNVGITARFSTSVTSIRTHASGASRWYNPGQTNSVLAFTLSYKFGGNSDGDK